MNKIRVISRILVSPFILGVFIVSYIFLAIRHFINFVRFGGEFITYQKDELTKIDDIYKYIKQSI